MSLNKPPRQLAAERNSSAIQGLNRREFMKAASISAGGALLGGAAGSLYAKTGVLPKPNKSGIEHIVLVTMENRSFDHFLGWLGGANGMQAGLSYADAAGNVHATYALSPDFQGCGHADPDHSYAGGRIQYDSGKCDGFLQTAPLIHSGGRDDATLGGDFLQSFQFARC